MKENRERFFGFRVTEAEFSIIEVMAKREGVKKAELLRTLVRKEIERQWALPIGLIELEKKEEVTND